MMDESILDVIDLGQLGERLQQARKRQGLTQAAAAQIIGVARTTMTAIEKGDRRIKASELLKLANAYGREVADFVRDRPIIEPLQVQFRSALSRTAEDETQVVESINLLEKLCLNYHELEQITGKPLVRSYPSVYQRKWGQSDQAAEAMAIAERSRLGLGEAPIPILRDFLEKDVGLRIFYLLIGPSSETSEVYFFEPTLGGCIAINRFQSNEAPERCRFSLAHAYAHFLAHRHRPTLSFADLYQRKPASERFADDFAIYFLMPTNSLKQRFSAMYQAQGKVTPADLVILAHYYGVSFHAMVLRLENLRLIPSGVWEKLQERGFQVQEARKQIGLGQLAEPTGMLPARYVRLAVEAYHAGEISEGELAHYLLADRLEARTIAADPKWRSKTDEAINQDITDLVTV